MNHLGIYTFEHEKVAAVIGGEWTRCTVRKEKTRNCITPISATPQCPTDMSTPANDHPDPL